MKKIFNWSKATVFDIETDGLLDILTKMHVLSFQMDGKDAPSSIKGSDVERVKACLEWHIKNKIPMVAHNGILFDVPAMEKLFDIDLSELMLIDTLGVSWYLNVERNSHGLDTFLSDYGIEKPKIDDWDSLTYEEYQHRCQEDVKINKALWEDFKARLVDMYTKSKFEIDSGFVGGKRAYEGEEIYIDSLKGLSVEEHIDRILTFLCHKIDTYRIQEKVGFLMDREHLEEKDSEFDKKNGEVKAELETVMPKIPKYVKRKKPANPFKRNGELSVTGAKWEELKRKYSEKEVDEFGTILVKISDNEITTTDGRIRGAEHIEEFEELSKYEDPNANSPDQIKEMLYSYGWVPETFNEVDDKPAIKLWEENGRRWKDKPPKRKVPQVTKKGEEGKELCQSVLRLAEEVPQIMVYANYNLVKHRSGVIKGFLKAVDENDMIHPSVGGFTNTLRVKHREVVNLVGVDKPYGSDIRGSFIAGEGKICLGSDLSSLEDRVKHHFMLPHDPEYVATMMEDDFDPHILMALTAKMITKEEFDKFKAGNKLKPVAAARKLGKSTNYAAQYGAQPPTIAKSAGVGLDVGTELFNAYWKLNWSIKAIAEEQRIIYDDKSLMWLINPINGFLYNIRKESDVFSTLCQGTGSYFFDMWVDFCLEEMWSTFKCKSLNLQMHDEIVVVHKDTPKLRDTMFKIVKVSIYKVNDTFKLRRKLDNDIQFGKKYSEIH